MASLVTILAVVLGPVGLGAQSTESPKGNPEVSSGEKWVYFDLKTGRELSSEQVASLEEKLAIDPNDVTSRTMLLGYYDGIRSIHDDSAKVAIRRHVLWLIRNSPESEVLVHPEAGIDHIRDPEGYSQARKAWMDQVKSQPQNAMVLANAEQFFAHGNRRTSIEFLKHAQSLDPSNPKWPKKLGFTYGLLAYLGSGATDQEISEEQLEQLETAYELSGESDRDLLLDQLAKSAFAADQLDKARQYAELMLQNTKAGRNYGDRVHQGNLMMGRIALRKGKIEEAKSRLIAAGMTPGSPVLRSFGPNMMLARALLEIGEREVVLEYFELCAQFWKSHRGRLDEWGELAAAGRMPDFRANLRY
ncbi:MAG: RNA polymerase subunit sigma-24 [Candidatus Aminicenantes bacterium]|nr:RNA polymerase subunit sigma-24 [Candidatus Aminicenantes bacterium]